MMNKNGRNYARPEKPIKSLDTLRSEAPIVEALNRKGCFGKFFQLLSYAAIHASDPELLKLYDAFWEWWTASLKKAVEEYKAGRLDI